MKLLHGVEDLRLTIPIHGNVEMMEVFTKHLLTATSEAIVSANLNMGSSAVRRIECGVERR